VSKNKSSFSGLLLNSSYFQHFEALLVDICECIVVTDHLIQNSSLAIIPNGGRSGFTLVMFLLASSDSVGQDTRYNRIVKQ